MRRGHGGRLPVPTVAELSNAAAEGREIVACSGLRHGPLRALRIGCHNNDIATVALNEHAALCLFAALKALFPNIESAPASPAKVRPTENGTEVECGHMSAES